MASEGMRWTLFAVACAGLVACGGGSTGGGGPDAFETGTKAFTLEGDDDAADLTNLQTALAAGLAVVSTANQVATLGIDNIVRQFGALDPNDIETDCEGGSGHVVISEPPGIEKRLLFVTDQCYDAQDDRVSDGQFSLDITDNSGSYTGSLQMGGDLAPLAIAQRTGSGVDFTQISGEALFDGDDDGVPFDLALTDLRVIGGDGDEPSGDTAFTPDRWLETLAGASEVGSLDVSIIGATSSKLTVSLNGPMVAEGHNLPTACTNIGRFTAQTSDLEINSSGRAVGGTLTLGASAATIEFLADGSANVSVVGGSRAFTGAEVAALCGI
jgi:hypothetical protein